MYGFSSERRAFHSRRVLKGAVEPNDTHFSKSEVSDTHTKKPVAYEDGRKTK